MSTALPALPTLPSLDGSASTYSTGTPPSTLDDVQLATGTEGLGTLGTYAAAAAQQFMGINNTDTLLTAQGVAGGSSTIMNIVFIILGIVLIGIGALSFRTTQNIIETGGKVAATVAA